MTSIVRRGYRSLRRLAGPKRARLKVPGYFEDPSDLVLTTASGRDNIALKLARQGWYGFEPPVPDVIAACVQLCGGTFFDVGANTGIYSLLAARSSATVQVHAFEPYARARAILQKNITTNTLSHRIRIVQHALSDQPGTQDLYVPLQNHGSIESSCSLNADFKKEHASVLKVQVTTIDDYVRAEEVDNLSLIKIDVESTEHRVVAGSAQTISRDRPLLVLEILHLADHQRLDRFCREESYRVFTLQHDVIQGRKRVAFNNSAWNQCFCPSEKIHLLERCAHTIGLGFNSRHI